MLSYNHENYLVQALESVLKQKTNFKYEIIIHDDASLDNSAKIIINYANRYPEMINPIIQSENQYSKGINIVTDVILPASKGEFIALCECDDFWNDQFKLQKQVDFLESNQKYTAVTHNTKFVDHNSKKIDSTRYRYMYGPFKAYNHNLSFYWRYPSMYPGHTATFVYRSAIFNNITDDTLKEFKKIRANGDMKRNLLLLLNGPIYHMEESMSSHRIVLDSGSSWKATNKGRNLSGHLFLSYFDMIGFSKRNYKTTIRPYYQLFHTGVASILKYIENKNDENKEALQLVRNEMKSYVRLLFTVLMYGVLSLPTIIIKLLRLDRNLILNDSDVEGTKHN